MVGRQDQLQGVCQLSGATWAFAAVKSDGSVVTWGDERKGGNSSHVQDSPFRVGLSWCHGSWLMCNCCWRFTAGAAGECEEGLCIFLVLCSTEM